MRPIVVLLALVSMSAMAQMIGPPALVTTELVDVATGTVTQYVRRTLTLGCGSDIPSVSVQTGTPGAYEWTIVRCKPPRYNYDTDAKGFIPNEVVKVVIKVCPVDNPAEFDTSNVTLDAGPTSRRLLGLTTLTKVGGGNFLISAAALGITVVCTWVTTCGKVANGLSTDAIIAQYQAQQGMITAIQQWQANQTAYDASQDVINQNAQNQIDTLNTTINGLNDILNASLDAIAKLSQTIDADNNLLAQRSADVAAQAYADFMVIGTYTDHQIDLLKNWTYASLSAQANYTDTNLAVLFGYIGDLNSQIISNGALTRRVATDLFLGAAGLNQDVDRASRIQLAAVMDYYDSIGFTRFVDPALPGVDPRALTTIEQTALIDNFKVNFVNTSDGGVTYIAHQVTFTLLTNIEYLSDNIPIGATWEDFLPAMGPPGCVANAQAAGQDPVTLCTIWITVQHTQCNAKAGFTWGSVTGGIKAPYTLTRDYCLNGADPVAGQYAGRMFDTLDQWHELLKWLCAPDQLYPGSLIQLVGERFGVINLPADDTPEVCSNVDLNLMMSTNTPGLPLIGVVYNTIALAFKTLRTEQNIYDRTKFGERPDGVYTELLPFYRASNGRSYNCYRSNQAMTRGGTSVTYQVTPTGVEPLFTWEVYDTEPTCDVNNQCTSGGTLLRTGNSATVLSQSIVGEGLLFNAEDVVIGELSPLSATVNDVSSKSISLDPTPGVRENTVGYLRCNFPDGYDITATPAVNPLMTACDKAIWSTQNGGADFQHDRVLSLSEYVRTLSNGQCDVVVGQDKNRLCSILDNFFVDSSTSMRVNAKLVFVPRVYNYEVQVDLDADISPQRVYAGCPEVSFQNDATGVYVELLNSLDQTITVQLDRANQDPSCEQLGVLTIELQPRQIYPVSVPSCGNYSAQVFKQGVSPPWVSCGPPITITVDPRYQSPVIASGLNNESLVLIQDTATMQAAAIGLFMMTAIKDVIYEGIVGTAPTIEQLDLGARWNATADATLAKLFALTVPQTVGSAAAAVAPDLALANWIENNVVKPGLAKLSDQITTNEAAIIAQDNLTRVIQDDMAAAIVAEDADIAALKAVVASLTTPSGSSAVCNCGSIFSIFSCIICWINTLLIYIIVAILLCVACYLRGPIAAACCPKKAAATGGAAYKKTGTIDVVEDDEEEGTLSY